MNDAEQRQLRLSDMIPDEILTKIDVAVSRILCNLGLDIGGADLDVANGDWEDLAECWLRLCGDRYVPSMHDDTIEMMDRHIMEQGREMQKHSRAGRSADFDVVSTYRR